MSRTIAWRACRLFADGICRRAGSTIARRLPVTLASAVVLGTISWALVEAALPPQQDRFRLLGHDSGFAGVTVPLVGWIGA